MKLKNPRHELAWNRLSRHLVRVCAAVVLLTVPPAKTAAPAQQPPVGDRQPPATTGFVDEAEVSIILFDVEVYDKNGEPIPGLTKRDFNVFERVREWEVYSVDDLCDTAGETESRLPAPIRTADDILPPTAPPGVSPPAEAAPSTSSAQQQRRFVMYFDFSQFRPDGRKRALAYAERWIRELMRPGDQLMMAGYATGTGLAELSGFSSDREELLARLHRAFEDRAFFDGFPAMLPTRIFICGKSSLSCDSYAQDEYRHSRSSFRMLRAMVQSLEQVPGRKTLFLFTQNGGLFPREYYVPERRNYAPTAANNWYMLQEVAADAMSSRTVINTVNAGGSQLMDKSAEQAVSTGWNFAESTGGDYNRGPRNAYDLLERSTNRQRCTYRIGLVPRQKERRSTHPVRVEVAGQVLPHRYRIQYLTRSERIFRRMAAVLARPSTEGTTPVYAAIRPVGIHDNAWRVMLQVGVELASLHDMPVADRTAKSWDIGALFHQVDGTRAWEFAGREEIAAGTADMDVLGALHERVMEIGPGHYRLRAAVHDLGAETYAGAKIDLDLPRPRKKGVLGPLCSTVGPAYRTSLPALRYRHRAITGRVVNALLPCEGAGRGEGTRLLMQTWLCTGKKKPYMAATVRGFVDRGGIPFYRLGRAELQASGSCLSVGHMVDTGLLSPGDYTYHVLVTGADDEQIELGTSPFTVDDTPVAVPTLSLRDASKPTHSAEAPPLPGPSSGK